jgi:hypothetical protein
MAFQEVTILKSPVSSRYFSPGCQGELDGDSQKIRMGGVWFDYDTDRWDIVGNDGDHKKVKLMAELNEYNTLEDSEFDELITAYAVPEETAMQWMVEAGNFERVDIDRMWLINQKCANCGEVCVSEECINETLKKVYCSERCAAQAKDKNSIKVEV